MGFFTKSISLVRRLSIFYLFVAVFSVFFGIFYYKYIPDNQSEIDTRGFRILNQLTGNIIQKNSNLLEAFDNLSKQPPAERSDILDQIRRQIPIVWQKYLGKGPSVRKTDSIGIRQAGDCSLVYILQSSDTAIIKWGEFIDPILATRDDLFGSYVLLQRGEGSRGGDGSRDNGYRDNGSRDNPKEMKLLYIQDRISVSPGLNADSALALQKNTDLADISTVTISGEAYMLFIQPFDLGSNRLVLGGLIRKSVYDRQTKTLPAHFVVGIMMVIILGLIFLPFLKVFFLSPNENVRKWDVLCIVLSLYLGAAVLLMAGTYFLADFSAHNRTQSNLRNIAHQLDSNIRRDLTDAGRQMNWYIAAYPTLKAEYKNVLNYKDHNSAHQLAVDRAFAPTLYPLTARIFWIDAHGATVAKWNPYSFISPRSSMKAYHFFSLLQQKNEADTSPVFYAGKSNITNEFQLVLARHLGPVAKGPANSNAAVLAFYFNSGIQPVLPYGYGYCLVDNHTGTVLMHSDTRRNLLENLFRETENNLRVRHCITYRDNSSTIDDVMLYGSPHTLFIQPVAGQDLSVVTFYNPEVHSENIFRMIHFAAETILYLALGFAICVLLSTSLASKPFKLCFDLDPIEWVRPLGRNIRSYAFTQGYFSCLIVMTLAFFYGLWWFGGDVRCAFYIAILLPFFALWGFVASRRKEKPRFPPDTGLLKNMLGGPSFRIGWLPGMFGSSRAIVITLVLLNWFIFRLINKKDFDHDKTVNAVILLFEGLALITMIFFYYREFIRKVRKQRDEKGQVMKDTRKALLKLHRTYLYSLCLSVLVMSVFPTLGALWYGWSVEKIQFIRHDQLDIAQRNLTRQQWVTQDLLPEMTPTVRRQLDNQISFTDSLLEHSGVYLSGQDIQYFASGLPAALPADSINDPDKPYITLLDELFLITSGEYNSYSIQRQNADTSWAFVAHQPDNICLLQKVRLDSGRQVGLTADSLRKDFQVCSRLHDTLFAASSIGLFHGSMFALFLLIALLTLPRLLALTVNRIFLLDFIKGQTPTEGNIMRQYFQSATFPVADYIRGEDGRKLPRDEQEEHILRTMISHKNVFEVIWKCLSPSERFFLYDFAKDGYTNYKDSEQLFVLLEKGLLVCNTNGWKLFSPSFREFILRKKGTAEITALRDEFSVPGVWATIRIPALIVIAACAVLLVMTQESISHRVTVMITSVGAIIPVVMEITKKVTGKGG